MPRCLGVRFDNGPRLHWMEVPSEVPERGTRCVVSGKRGPEIAEVRTEPRETGRASGQVLRPAADEDLANDQRLRQRAEDLKWLLRARAREQGADLKIVSLEFTLDESVLVVSYSTEGQAPLRMLAAILLEHTRARIEFNNVGPRDQARILGTLGRCGEESCSSRWMQSFNAVSIRMARDQQLPLNPEKISGPCGRLMCCLQFEHDMYRELLKGMPKKGGRACHTESGACGRVVKLDPLKQTVDLRTEDGMLSDVPANEIERPHVRRQRND